MSSYYADKLLKYNNIGKAMLPPSHGESRAAGGSNSTI